MTADFPLTNDEPDLPLVRAAAKQSASTLELLTEIRDLLVQSNQRLHGIDRRRQEHADNLVKRLKNPTIYQRILSFDEALSRSIADLEQALSSKLQPGGWFEPDSDRPGHYHPAKPSGDRDVDRQATDPGHGLPVEHHSDRSASGNPADTAAAAVADADPCAAPHTERLGEFLDQIGERMIVALVEDLRTRTVRIKVKLGHCGGSCSSVGDAAEGTPRQTTPDSAGAAYTPTPGGFA